MLKNFYTKIANNECEPSQTVQSTPDKNTKEKICIIGAGIEGISSAYFLARKGGYEITVIDKDNPIKGASEQNGSTVTFIPYPAWTTLNFWKVLKDTVTRVENPSSYFNFALIFDSHFRFWLKHYMNSRSEAKIKQSNKALASMINYSISIFDDYINEVTDNDPDKVEYHHETLVNIYRGCSGKELKEKEAVFKEIQSFDSSCVRLTEEELVKFPGASLAYRLAVRCFNSGKF
jgi:hypothetical protein